MVSNLQLLGVLVLLHPWIAGSSSSDPLRPDEQRHDYLRFADVERHCEPVLSSAAGLACDAYRARRLMQELPFEQGDWRQGAGQAPLMPFDGGDVPGDARVRPLDPLYLATFVITHSDDQKLAGTRAVNVSAVLVLTVSRKNRDPEIRPHRWAAAGSLTPEFKLSPGATKLRIIFEGVYTERDDGERVVCMVGSAVLPTRSTGGGGRWDWAQSSGRKSFLPPVTADQNILLVLRYPKQLTLTTRAILGEMRSTSASSAAAYFDPVHLDSQLRWPPSYRFSDDLVAGACSPLPPIDAADSGRASHRYNGSSLCDVLWRYGGDLQSVVTALPNRRCNSTACPSLGQFEMGRAVGADDIAGVTIAMQDLHCYEYKVPAGTVRVTVVLRATPPWEDRPTAAQRSGTGGATLFAEGVWVASAGQGCLLACQSVGKEECRFRVCLYMPMTFSITDRAVLRGRITGIDAPAGDAAPSSLSFALRLSLPLFWFSEDEQLAFAYNYTKVERAGDLLRRSGSPSSVRGIIAKSLHLSYAGVDPYHIGDDRRNIASLAEKLALRFTTTPSMFTQQARSIEQPVLQLQVTFLGQVSDRSFLFHYPPAAPPSMTSKGSGQLLLNVSAELAIFNNNFLSSTLVMSLEGVYSPQAGRMCLIGCRDVGFPWRNLSATGDLEEGMDCSIEVNVQYPPTVTYWFIWWRKAKVRIESARSAGDPLRFDTVNLRAVPSQYPPTLLDELRRETQDGVLCIVLLAAAIAAALRQLRHLRTHTDVAPYVSHVTLGAQSLGFAAALFGGIDALLARVSDDDVSVDVAESRDRRRYARVSTPQYQSMDRTVRALSLAALVLTLRLARNVWRGRARSSPRPRPRAPGDGKVFVCSGAVHLALVVLVLAVSGRQGVTVEQHVALMQDLFLLPQAIGNAVWRVNCRPLAGSYYLGVTAARLLPRLSYDNDCVRAPVPVGSLESLDAGRRCGLSGVSDVVILAVSVLLGLVVYVQQQWNYGIVGRMGMVDHSKLHHM